MLRHFYSGHSSHFPSAAIREASRRRIFSLLLLANLAVAAEMRVLVIVWVLENWQVAESELFIFTGFTSSDNLK